jgi:hypothetical protein
MYLKILIIRQTTLLNLCIWYSGNSVTGVHKNQETRLPWFPRFCTVTHTICESSAYVTLLAHRILRWPLDFFEKLCIPVQNAHILS